MGYKRSLEAAGAKVIAFQKFGDFQGTWLAKVEFNGQVGWIKDYFGSCSGCDAYFDKFDHIDEPSEHNGKYYSGRYEYIGHLISRESYLALKDGYNNLLAQFGLTYLQNLMTQDEIEAECSKDLSWDMERSQMLAFVKENAI